MGQRSEIRLDNALTWIDILKPNKDDLISISKDYAIDLRWLLPILDSETLPRFEKFENGELLILRCSDASSPQDSDSTQELTTKLSIFLSSNVLITLHRQALPFLEDIKQDIKSKSTSKYHLAFDLSLAAVQSFYKPLNHALDELDELEMGLFGAHGARPFSFQKAYLIKRKAFVFKRMVRLTFELASELQIFSEASGAQRKHFKSECGKMFYYCEELSENTFSILNLHLSMASQQASEASNKTNEVMRILTVLSMFLLPLNVITGIYGMNFEFMPELKWPLGYFLALGLMLGTSLVIFFWFRHKGWLKSEKGDLF